jgi:hypothetical protein
MGDHVAEMQEVSLSTADAAFEHDRFAKPPRFCVLDPPGQIMRHGTAPNILL